MKAQSTEKDLVSLATPILEMVMRIRASQLVPSSEMRQTVASWLKELEARGQQLGFKEPQLQNTKFALAAFVDETVMAGGHAIRNEWERFPLQLEYFQEQFAGVKFFERMDVLLKNAESEADVLEVYYLCLLLGFKGKYHIYLEDQLPGVLQNVAEHLRRVGRLRAAARRRAGERRGRAARGWLRGDEHAAARRRHLLAAEDRARPADR